MRVFEKPSVVEPEPLNHVEPRDSGAVVPAQEDPVQEAFIGRKLLVPDQDQRWNAVSDQVHCGVSRRTGQSRITHYASVERIESYGDSGKYRLIFAEAAKEIPPIPLGDLPLFMKSPRYTSLAKLLKTKSVGALFGKAAKT